MRLYLTEDSCYLDKATMEVSYIRIEFAGNSIIEDVTPSQYLLYLHKTTLNIYITDTEEIHPIIESLFKYQGRLSIKRAILFYKTGLMEHLSVVNKKFQYVSDRITTYSDDMSLLSEEMRRKKPLNVKKTKLKKVDRIMRTRKLKENTNVVY